MERMIDCLFIGHNEMKFQQYEQMVRAMGKKSPAYRDLSMSFINYNNSLYTVSDMFNHFRQSQQVNLGEVFSPAIAYLGTYLNRRGFTFDYVNTFQQEKAVLAEKLQQNNIRAIAIITTLYVSVFPVLELIAFIKKYNQTAKIILGGPLIATQVRTTPNQETLEYFFKNTGADFYVDSSQGEATLVKILDALQHNKSCADIPNLAYKTGQGYTFNSIEVENNQLAVNMVDWNIFQGRITQFAAVRTAISCPFRCSFCGFPQHAGSYQTVDVAAIEEELNALDALGVVTSLNFIDDTFNVPPERFKEILRMMIKNKYKFKWNSHYRCQFADEETVALMKESGCEGVFLGIESGSPQILLNMNKNATVEKYRSGIALLKKYGIVNYASFIIGFPGETFETVRETVDFIEETGPDFFRTQLWYCDPITPIWEQRDKYGIKGSSFEWAHATMDAGTACDLIEEIFVSVENSVWVPQYNFEFGGIFSLLHRGMSLDQVKDFLRGFNQGIAEKIEGGGQISTEVESKMRRAFGGI